MNPVDLTILRWFNALAGMSPALDTLVAAFTDYAPVLFALLFAGYFMMTRTETDRMRRTVMLAGLSGVLGLTVAVVLASITYRARPFVAVPDQVRLLMPHPADSSFPSDHATGSAAFAVGMWRAPDRAARWIFSITAVLVGLSRLVAGVHWPSDILGSFLLGGLAAQATFAVLARPLTPLLDWGLGLYGNLESRWGRR
jgi:undecaprenyl-diphosphatase